MKIPIKIGFVGIFFGASNRVRTDDLMITNQVLYQLSYAGKIFCHKGFTPIQP